MLVQVWIWVATILGMGDQSISVVFFCVCVCVWVCVNIDNDMNAKGEKSETILLKIMATVLLKDTFKRVYFISIKALFGINETIDFPFISFFLLTIYFFKHSDVESSQLLWD